MPKVVAETMDNRPVATTDGGIVFTISSAPAIVVVDPISTGCVLAKGGFG